MFKSCNPWGCAVGQGYQEYGRSEGRVVRETARWSPWDAEDGQHVSFCAERGAIHNCLERRNLTTLRRGTQSTLRSSVS